jgi:hypothetical protein
MKRKTLQFGQDFNVVIGNRRVQAAQMVIGPGDSEGGPENRHRSVSALDPPSAQIFTCFGMRTAAAQF